MTVEDRQRNLRNANHELAEASELWCEAKAARMMSPDLEIRLTLAECNSRKAQSKLDKALRKVYA